MQHVCHTGLAMSELGGQCMRGMMCDTGQDRQKEKFAEKPQTVREVLMLAKISLI